MPAPYSGSCQCGAMKFEITAEPLTVYVCHCNACKKQSGSAFGMALIAPADAVKMTEGTPKSYTKTAQSGRTADCDFCPECGNRLFHRLGADAPIVLVKTGIMDDPGQFEPVVHLWTESADPWVVIPDDVVAYDQQPADRFAEAMELYKAKHG
jgi:hypothetical protein